MITHAERRRKEELAALLLEQKERREGDSLRAYKPHPAQDRFIKSVLYHEKKENWFVAANRSGKSDAGVYIGATLARFGDQSDDVRYVKGAGSDIQVRDRATSGWVVSLDFPSSRDIVQPKYFDNGFLPPGATHDPFIPEREISEWRVSDQILKLKNGSIVGFKSADSGRKKFQGTEKDWVHIDEEPDSGIYDEITIRVGQRPLNLFGTCTLLPPEGQVGGVTWIYSDKVMPWKQGKVTDIGIFTSSIYDNPHIDPEEISRLEAIYPLGSVQRRIRLDGELIGGVGGARVYAGFSHEVNVRTQPDIQLRRPLCWVWDFNVEPMVSLIGQREKGMFRVYREIVLDEGHIGDMVEKFRAIHPTHFAPIYVYGDARGRDRSHHDNLTSYNLIFDHMKDYPAPLQMKVPEKNPSVTSRINSVNNSFRDAEGVIMMEVDPICEELILDFEQVQSDGKQGIKKVYNRKDPYFRRTHTSDAIGYWTSMEAPV